MVKNAVIAIIIFSFWALAGGSRVQAQEVVYVLPVSPGSGAAQGGANNRNRGNANGASIETPARFEGSEAYETDLRNRGLWRPRTRRDLYARPGNSRDDTGLGSGNETGNAVSDGAGRRSTPEGNSTRMRPVEGTLAGSNLRSGALSGGSAHGGLNGSGVNGLTEAYSPNLNGDTEETRTGLQNREGRMVDGTMVSGARPDERQPGARSGNPQGRRASTARGASRSTPAATDAVDDTNYGPPEDFGITAQGAVDPLTGEVLPARAPLVTGTSGQPPQSASDATTSAAFNSAVGAGGTGTNVLVEGAITTVRDRTRPEWDPLGARWGRFLVRPSIDNEIEYTDNAALSRANRKSDIRFVLRPSIAMDSDFSRHGLSINLSGELARHAHEKSENYVQFDASLLGRLDVRRNTTIDTELRYGLSQEERSSTNGAAGSGKRPFVHSYHASVRGSQRFNRLVFSLRGAIDHTDYERYSSVTGRDDRDYSDLSTTARLSYNIRPGMLVYTQGSYSARRHSQRIDNAGLARNSDGVTAEIGTTLALGRHMRADLSVGHIFRDYDDATLEDVSAFSANADIAWNVTEMTTLRAGISTVVDETTVANASANVVRELVFGIDHELRRNFIIGAEFSLGKTKAIGSSVSDVVYVLDLNADYRLNRRAAITANLTRRKQNSTRANGDYTEHTATLGLNLRL